MCKYVWCVSVSMYVRKVYNAVYGKASVLGLGLPASTATCGPLAKTHFRRRAPCGQATPLPRCGRALLRISTLAKVLQQSAVPEQPGAGSSIACGPACTFPHVAGSNTSKGPLIIANTQAVWPSTAYRSTAAVLSPARKRTTKALRQQAVCGSTAEAGESHPAGTA